MAKAELAGSRIRTRRMDLRIRQAELARACDISPSYLNLIEHNRRRIGGKLLNDIARHLEVDPASLSEGAGTERLRVLHAIAAEHPELTAETGRAEEFAGRFPGWAALLSAQSERIDELGRTVEILADRLAHDPYLSASLHDVLSSVTSIRSTSAILVDDSDLPPDWTARFHRNLYEDSQRLAETSQALVSYLDAGSDASSDVGTPQEEVRNWYKSRHYHVNELEDGDIGKIDDLISSGSGVSTDGAEAILRRSLRRYAEDADRMPLQALRRLLEKGDLLPDRVASLFGVDLAAAMRRLASLPPDPTRPPLGLVSCDISGALTVFKDVDGFPMPRFGSGCPLWPLYRSLAQPTLPTTALVAQPGTPERRFRCYAVALPTSSPGFGGPLVLEATMLIVPENDPSNSDAVSPVGLTCRVCPREACPARNEPSILSN